MEKLFEFIVWSANPLAIVIYFILIFKGLFKFKTGPKQNFSNRHSEPSMFWHFLKASFFVIFGIVALIHTYTIWIKI